MLPSFANVDISGYTNSMKPWGVTLIFVGILGVGMFVTGCRSRTATPATSSAPHAELVVDGLDEPVDLVFLSKDSWLVAERRTGVIRLIEAGALRQQPFATLPVPGKDVAQAAAPDNTSAAPTEDAAPPETRKPGLLSLTVDPDFPTRPYVYALHTLPDGASQQVTRLTVKNGVGVNAKALITGLPATPTGGHNGGRLFFANDGKLYVALGDAGDEEAAQNYDDLRGKVLRYNADGTVPADNPLEEQRTQPVDYSQLGKEENVLSGNRTPVYTIGHRNVSGIVQHPESNDIYILENGAAANDELNRLAPGDNYGWPLVQGRIDDPRYHAPLWASGATTVAPTGAAFYRGTEFPAYRENLFFASEQDGKLRRVIFSDPDTVKHVAIVPEAGTNARLDVAIGPEGRLYFTSNTGIYRLVPGG